MSASPLAPVALLGGTFDPVHAGHLQLARDALAHLPVGTLRLLPAGQPWQKAGVTAAVHRVAMLEQAMAAWPAAVRDRIALDLREVHRDGPTYTVDTLAALRGELGPDRPLVLIVGSDQLARLDTWRAWERLGDLAHLAVARRDGTALRMPAAVAARYPDGPLPPERAGDTPAGRLVLLPMTPVAASASTLRALLAAGRPYDARVAEWLAAPVLHYIERNHLYT